MKKTAILVVCVLLLCGGLCHLYLIAQVLEAEDLARPTPIRMFSPVMPAEGSFVIAETSAPHPMPRPVNPADVIRVQTMPQAFPPGTRPQPLRPVAAQPVAPPRTTAPDISKFRLPIEYKLKNIPTESLIDFLVEEFSQVKAEALEEAGAISITASLADHRIIKDMLIELEREIAALRSAAANIAEATERKIVVFTNEEGFKVGHVEASKLLEHMNTLGVHWSSMGIAFDESTNSWIVAGTAEQIAAIEALIEKLGRPVADQSAIPTLPVF